MIAELDARGDDLAGVTARLFTTPEVAEGMSAFLERRLPSWATPDASRRSMKATPP